MFVLFFDSTSNIFIGQWAFCVPVARNKILHCTVWLVITWQENINYDVFSRFVRWCGFTSTHHGISGNDVTPTRIYFQYFNDEQVLPEFTMNHCCAPYAWVEPFKFTSTSVEEKSCWSSSKFLPSPLLSKEFYIVFDGGWGIINQTSQISASMKIRIYLGKL